MKAWVKSLSWLAGTVIATLFIAGLLYFLLAGTVGVMMHRALENVQ